MTDRVRAVLVTPSGALLTIKRVRPDAEPYWVLPGGGVEPTDASLEDALAREIHEELAGQARVHSLIHVEEIRGESQYFFLARIDHWDPTRRSGPEFTDPTRGAYIVEEIPLTSSALAGTALKPESVGDLLVRHASDLFHLADLRTSRPA
ncbi:DNA mismatch repair protein MutT [Sphaerisporangium melleum]|uniref:DNA mismatch repair protein MutT n=1 Tax=Sphaerisporangium melleum TaxID=321316 RepID=A0A917VGF1_9ACTN|nr:NUDIX domain-containing protein [Sphaerisporangium melleum]GGK72704.1 DNA mismatch repair protein MutT [Sphaerisporangium melleum]GII68305.1 DNA mismatch repair protein MutT [Sphaerisporangium melleum]